MVFQKSRFVKYRGDLKFLVSASSIFLYLLCMQSLDWLGFAL